MAAGRVAGVVAAVERVVMAPEVVVAVPPDGLVVVRWHVVPVGFAPTLVSPTKLANGSFQFSFTNLPGASFTALAKTNLNSAWTSLGLATEISPGHFQFTDPRATNYPMRVYKVSSP